MSILIVGMAKYGVVRHILPRAMYILLFTECGEAIEDNGGHINRLPRWQLKRPHYRHLGAVSWMINVDIHSSGRGSLVSGQPDTLFWTF